MTQHRMMSCIVAILLLALIGAPALTRAQEAFTRFGIYDALPKDHVFRSVDEAIKSLDGKA